MRTELFLKSSLFCLLASTAALLASPGRAADYEPPPVVEAPEYVPVEVGSGWYLRGDVAYDFEKNFQDTHAVVSSEIKHAPYLYDVDHADHSEDETPWIASAGFGYHFNDFLRGDLNVGVLASDHYSGDGVSHGGCAGSTTKHRVYDDKSEMDFDPIEGNDDCDSSVSISTSGYTAMANGYIDLGTVAGVTPYVGAGAGLLYTRTKIKGSVTCTDIVRESDGHDAEAGMDYKDTSTFNCSTNNTQSVERKDTDYDWMYSLSAGLAYQIAANTSLDIGYQFSSAPDAVFYTVGDHGLNEHEGVQFHQVKVGLRYDLW